MAGEIKPAYLIAGDDEAKIDATRRRLRLRAERDGGATALEVFEPQGPRRGPDAEALMAAIAAMSLSTDRRYLLAERVGAWGKGDAESVAAALAAIPAETTVVLVAGEKPPKPLAKAVEAAGGEILEFAAPRARDLPKRLVVEARELGFTLEPEAARLLVDRLGTGSIRLRNELERLALWAGEGGVAEAADLESMIADTSEAEIWSLADAIVEGDREAAVAVAERLVAQGEPLVLIIRSLSPRLRQAHRAAVELEAGSSPKQVASDLKMHPYAAKMLVSRVKSRSPAEVQRAIVALADLEVWSRGGSDYGEGVALTLAVRQAAGPVAVAEGAAG